MPSLSFGERSKFPMVGEQKHARKHWYPICEMYATSHKRPFVPSVGGFGLLCDVMIEGPAVSFVKYKHL